MFARFVGRLYWTCPSCDHVQWAQVKQVTTHVRCKSCGKPWILGVTLWSKPLGVMDIPRDMLLIAEGFANKRLANRVYCETCGKALFEEKPQAGRPVEAESGKPLGRPRKKEKNDVD